MDGMGCEFEMVFSTALFALRRGARGLEIDPAALDYLRDRFRRKIDGVLQHPEWRERWVDEQCYVQGHAEAMMAVAARLAAEDRRASITRGDVELAMLKMRGRLPIAGRWCPF